MAKKSHRKRRKRRNYKVLALYCMLVILILGCLFYIYKVNKQRKAEHRVQQERLMEEETLSDPFRVDEAVEEP